MFTGQITGRLGADPETRTLSSGKTVTNLRIATDYGWGDRKVTTWTRVALWGTRGEACAKHFSKGDGIVVFGEVYQREYEGKYYLEMDGQGWAFPPRSSSDGRSHGGSGGHDDGPSNYGGGGSSPDDEIPF